jgi:TRAP transporter 4TM/12TM fusion protein
MSGPPPRAGGDAVDARVHDRESPPAPLPGVPGVLATTLAAGLALYALYWVVAIVQPQGYRLRFLLGCLVLTFVLYPFRRGTRRLRVPSADWLRIAVAAASIVWPLVDFDQFIYRATEPEAADVVLGTALIVLVIEATRRTSGPVLAVVALGFLAYAWAGPFLDLVGLSIVAHRGYGLDRIVGTLYMTLEGVFGVPLDVASTYIILFTVFGAVLERSGAARFLLDWSRAAAGRSHSGAAAGRAVTLAGCLLGTVSGSGVATTVMLGSVSWPMLRRAGYPKDTAGAVLSAAGIGAIIVPPVMGAAAFLIAEFLKIPYLQVLTMAVVPALLYYLSVLLMIEADSRRLGTKPAAEAVAPLAQLTRRGWYHFISLGSVAVLLIAGVTTFRAVFWATLVACALSVVRRETALTPRRLLAALDAGGRGILPVAATTAAAGIIVGVVTLTGLGLRVAGLIVALAGGRLFLTVVYAALAVWTLGLAVPVTASYIIAAVMVAPAMIDVGVAPAAAHMFIFYYAVLSEVSPPTALAPFAAAALTGGNPFKTMMLTWKYTAPAFLVPFVFAIDPRGMGLLLQGSAGDLLTGTATAAVGVAAVAAGSGGWIRQAATPFERALAVAGGALLCYPSGAADAAGLVITASAVALHAWRTRAAR